MYYLIDLKYRKNMNNFGRLAGSYLKYSTRFHFQALNSYDHLNKYREIGAWVGEDCFDAIMFSA